MPLTAMTDSTFLASLLSTSNITPHTFTPAENKAFPASDWTAGILSETVANDSGDGERQLAKHARDRRKYGGKSSLELPSMEIARRKINFLESARKDDSSLPSSSESGMSGKSERSVRGYVNCRDSYFMS